MPRITNVKCLSNTGLSSGYTWARSIIKSKTDACSVFQTPTAQLKIPPDPVSGKAGTVTLNISGKVAQSVDCICWQKVNDDKDVNGETTTYYGVVRHYEQIATNSYIFYVEIDAWLSFAPLLGEIKAWMLRAPAVKFSEQTNITDRLLREPFDVPLIMESFNLDNTGLGIALSTVLNNGFSYGVYLTTDPNGVYQDSNYQYVGGVPIIGTMTICDTPDAVAALLKKYVNSTGNILSQNTQPLLTRAVKVVYAPRFCLQNLQESWSKDFILDLTGSAPYYTKENSPQFFRAELLDCSTGHTLPIDALSTYQTGNKVYVAGTLTCIGGTNPQLALNLKIPDAAGGEKGSFVKIMHSMPFFEIPVASFTGAKNSAYGMVLEALSGASQTAGALGTLGAIAGPEGLAAGAAIGAVGGALEGVWKGANAYLGENSSAVIKHTSPNAEASYAMNAYKYEIVMMTPTPEGERLLRDMFDKKGETVGYFDTLPEEGYVQIDPTIFRSSTPIPRGRLEEIKALLAKGLYIDNGAKQDSAFYERRKIYVS